MSDCQILSPAPQPAPETAKRYDPTSQAKGYSYQPQITSDLPGGQIPR